MSFELDGIFRVLSMWHLNGCDQALSLKTSGAESMSDMGIFQQLRVSSPVDGVHSACNSHRLRIDEPSARRPQALQC